jgi:hypothetical protein
LVAPRGAGGYAVVMNREIFPAMFQLMGAMAVVALALLFVTVFDWGSPPSPNSLPMRSVASARSR